jgi:hypothetical protein
MSEKVETHSEYLTGKIIPTLKSFSNSFLIVASSVGLMGLCFYLTGFMPSLIGMKCYIRVGSKPQRSS